MSAAFRVAESVKAVKRGWALTPLRGKVPVSAGWQAAPKAEASQAITWARAGNVGLRTGAVSGIVVIDVDTAKGGDASGLHLPRTVTVITGSGGLHLYFRHPGGIVGNSVGKLAPHVDVRGDGGQVVFVGSLHPDTGRVYQWAEGLSPDELTLAELPDEIYRQITAGRERHSAYCAQIAERIRPRIARLVGTTPYGRTAMAREVHAVRISCEGSRNDTLNRAAYCLGQLVAAGHLSEATVIAALRQSAADCGLTGYEIDRTIASGLEAGEQEPRR